MQSAISKMQEESKTGILITWVVQIRFRNRICTTQVIKIPVLLSSCIFEIALCIGHLR